MTSRRHFVLHVTDTRKATRLTQRLVDRGFSVDRTPKPTHTEVIATGEGDEALLHEVIDGLDVEVVTNTEV